MSNEAAERLRDRFRSNAMEHIGEEFEEALATERKATVGRIRGAVEQDIERGEFGADRVLAILDSESER